jgi:hypothetical protein
VTYDVPGLETHTFPLVYYLGFYLPIVAAAKLTQLSPEPFFFWWGFLGVCLSLMWFCRIAEARSSWAIFGFALFSGLDVLGAWIFRGQPMRLGEHWEWWCTFQFTANTTLLFWVPQHSLSGWALTGMCFHQILFRRASLLGWLGACALFWSPFVAVGLYPFFLVAALLCDRKSWASWGNLGAVILFPILCFYFAANLGKIPRDWMWNAPGYHSGWWTEYFWFVFLEFLLLAGLAILVQRPTREQRFWWFAVALSLLILPLYRMGQFNDFVMRASIPAMFLCCCFVWRALDSVRPRKPPKWRFAREALWLCLSLGALTPLSEITRSLMHYSDNQVALRSPAHSVVHLGSYTIQYLGREDSFFFRHLASSRPNNTAQIPGPPPLR